MSTLLLWASVGVAFVVFLSWLHGEIETPMIRAKFIFLSLMGIGSLPLGYVAFWFLLWQRPSFDVTYLLAFWATMWLTAFAQSIVHTLSLRDTVASR